MMQGTNWSECSTASNRPISNRCRRLGRVSKNYGYGVTLVPIACST